MKKTKKEKLKAVLHRQKEFERINYSLNLSPTEKVGQSREQDYISLTTLRSAPKKVGVEASLTDLSYLPKQLIKIGLITSVLIAVQLILSLIL